MGDHIVKTNLPLGIASGIAAGALWGIVFLGPEILKGFTALELVAGRYILYGVLSACFLVPSWQALRPKLRRGDYLILSRLGLTANIIYYLCLSVSVHLTGVAPAALIVGMLPITVTLLGTREAGALTVRQLSIPLILVALGLVSVNIDVFSSPQLSAISPISRCLGLLAAFGALASWTDYAVANARYLQKNPKFTNREWSLLSGVVTGGLALCLLPILLVTNQSDSVPRSWAVFLEVNLVVAVGSSIMGNSFWNAASRLLPLTLSGQMIIFETLFALLYGFLFEHRFPRTFEWWAIALLTLGVAWSTTKHQRSGNR